MVYNTDGNVESLNRYMKQQDENEIAYEAMMDELSEALTDKFEELREEHNKICKKYGWEDTKFIDTVSELI